MIKFYNPEGAPKPVGAYSHVGEVPAGMTTFHISGQVGVDETGKVQEGAEAQLDQIWRNILGVLKGSGLGPENVVKIVTFLTRKEDVPLSRAARQRAMGDHKPASTLLIVAGLAGPEYLAEIEVIAAK